MLNIAEEAWNKEQNKNKYSVFTSYFEDQSEECDSDVSQIRLMFESFLNKYETISESSFDYTKLIQTLSDRVVIETRDIFNTYIKSKSHPYPFEYDFGNRLRKRMPCGIILLLEPIDNKAYAHYDPIFDTISLHCLNEQTLLIDDNYFNFVNSSEFEDVIAHEFTHSVDMNKMKNLDKRTSFVKSGNKLKNASRKKYVNQFSERNAFTQALIRRLNNDIFSNLSTYALQLSTNYYHNNTKPYTIQQFAIDCINLSLSKLKAVDANVIKFINYLNHKNYRLFYNDLLEYFITEFKRNYTLWFVSILNRYNIVRASNKDNPKTTPDFNDWLFKHGQT